VKRDLTLAIMKSTPSLTLLVISASCFPLPFANAVDWPQWRGINRDGISSEKISPASWGKDGRADWMTLGVSTGMLGLWLTERWHGYDIAVICVVGALILTLPRFSVLIEMVGQALIWLTPSSALALVGVALTGLGYSLVYLGLGVETIRRVPPQSRGSPWEPTPPFRSIVGTCQPCAGLDR
jgi:hypothetical protein